MAIFTLSVNNPSPALEKKFQEVTLIHRALEMAANDVRGPGGIQTSGTIKDGGIVLGTWTYTAQASS